MQEAAQQEILPLLTQSFRDSGCGSFTNFEHYHKIVVTVWPRRLKRNDTGLSVIKVSPKLPHDMKPLKVVIFLFIEILK